MAITYNWVVSSMNEYPTTTENLNDVVFLVNWRRNATETVGDKVYFVDTYGVLTLPAPDPQNFTPYNDLTFEQVCGWLDAGEDVAWIDAGLAESLQKLIDPPVISLPLPWNTPSNP